MDWYDFLLLVHVLGAFAMVGATVMFVAMVIAGWRSDRISTHSALARLVKPATAIVIFGSVVTLVFGIWLAIYVDGYELWDFWILAAIVLWAISTETGRRGGKYHEQEGPVLRGLAESGQEVLTPEARAVVPNRTGLLLDTVSTAALALILVLMIFKPGA